MFMFAQGAYAPIWSSVLSNDDSPFICSLKPHDFFMGLFVDSVSIKITELFYGPVIFDSCFLIDDFKESATHQRDSPLLRHQILSVFPAHSILCIWFFIPDFFHKSNQVRTDVILAACHQIGLRDRIDAVVGRKI